MVLVKPDISMEKKPSRSVLIAQHIDQLQMDQRPQHKIRISESDRGESANLPLTHWQMKRLSEHNTISTGTKSTINNWDLMNCKSSG